MDSGRDHAQEVADLTEEEVRDRLELILDLVYTYWFEQGYDPSCFAHDVTLLAKTGKIK